MTTIKQIKTANDLVRIRNDIFLEKFDIFMKFKIIIGLLLETK